MDTTVVKAVSVLEALARSDKPSRLTDLGSTLGLAKSNVHRLLKTLEALGYVRQRTDGTYEATLRMWEQGVQVLGRLDIRRVARPHLEQLAAESKEAVHLSHFDCGEVVYLDKIESEQPVRAYTQVGGRAPSYCTATGKVLLAFQSPAVIDAVLAKLHSFTPRTVVDRTALSEQLDAIRRNGWAINRGEWRANVHGLGAPIFADTGRVIAAVGISGLDERLRPKALKALTPAVVDAAQKISRELGYNNG